MREVSDMGELRSALYTDRDLSGIILDSEREEMWREYLRHVPAEVLATGVRWTAEGKEIRGIDVEEHDHVALRVCGIEWWRGDAGMEILRWSCGPSWECLQRYEDEYPGDMRPRDAILARWSYAHGRIELGQWLDASRAAWDAANSAARSAAWYAARAAAVCSSRPSATYAARAAASSAAWDVTLERYKRSWDLWAVEVWR